MKVASIKIKSENEIEIIYEVVTVHWFGLQIKVNQYKEVIGNKYVKFPCLTVLFAQSGEVLGVQHEVTDIITNYKKQW